ncbi:hypothetical protein COOONC_11405 [Cooperia oncophora]
MFQHEDVMHQNGDGPQNSEPEEMPSVDQAIPADNTNASDDRQPEQASEEESMQKVEHEEEESMQKAMHEENEADGSPAIAELVSYIKGRLNTAVYYDMVDYSPFL